MYVTMEVATKPMPIPASTMRIGWMPPRHPSAVMSAAVRSDPMTAHGAIARESDVPITAMAVTAAADPPAVTPRRSGDASGLRATDCNRAPETPSSAPTKAAVYARGARSCPTTKSAPSEETPTPAFNTSGSGKSIWPVASEVTTLMRRTAASARGTRIARLERSHRRVERMVRAGWTVLIAPPPGAGARGPQAARHRPALWRCRRTPRRAERQADPRHRRPT